MDLFFRTTNWCPSMITLCHCCYKSNFPGSWFFPHVFITVGSEDHYVQVTEEWNGASTLALKPMGRVSRSPKQQVPVAPQNSDLPWLFKKEIPGSFFSVPRGTKEAWASMLMAKPHPCQLSTLLSGLFLLFLYILFQNFCEHPLLPSHLSLI